MPLPWDAAGAGFDFTDGVPWLPQPRDRGKFAASEQEHDAGSFPALYRPASARRCTARHQRGAVPPGISAALGTDESAWVLTG